MVNLGSKKDILNISKKTTKTDYLIEINSEIQSLEQQKRQFNQETLKNELKSEGSVLKAPIDGVIHVQTEVNRGDYLHEGIEVITIVPQVDADSFKIQLSVKNEDIANIKTGDKINFRLHALPYQQYGQLTGEITGISSDAVYDQESGVSYYVVKASVEKNNLLVIKG